MPQLSSATATAPMTMRLDVRETDKAYHVVAELPGLNESEVERTFDDSVLTLRGEKKVDRDKKSEKWHIVECRHGRFSRQLSLPATIDAENIEARFDKGVLNVTLPKAAPEQATAKNQYQGGLITADLSIFHRLIPRLFSALSSWGRGKAVFFVLNQGDKGIGLWAIQTHVFMSRLWR